MLEKLTKVAKMVGGTMEVTINYFTKTVSLKELPYRDKDGILGQEMLFRHKE